jgi:hypothetical protein
LGKALGANNGHLQGSFYMASELACDDRLGGGGSGDQVMQAIDLIRKFSTDQSDKWWTGRYEGVYRANSAIENLDKCEMPDTKRQKFLGEAYFLRAFYYYELASMFERVPLHLTTEAMPLPQASPDETWGQIISDLKKAIELMPAEKTPAAEAGHVDKYVAEAMMGRAFLFYTGFYNKTDVTLPDGSKVIKKDVIGWIDDCVSNSGYELATDFRSLWAYSNKYTRGDYRYTAADKETLTWGDDDMGNNSEAMFVIKFNKLADWGESSGFNNGFAVFSGLRGGGGESEWSFPFGLGWGAGPVAPKLWEEWPADDSLRKKASISDFNEELTADYPAGGGWGDWIQETKLHAKKVCSITGKAGGKITDPFDKLIYGFDRQWDVCIIHDLVLIRFADVLLMQSELKGDATGINAVRARVGLPQAVGGYTLENLQNERRYELAFEGVRWNDLRRWGADYAKESLAKQGGVDIGVQKNQAKNKSADDYKRRYEATRGFFPIPETQIMLANELYTQNPGWNTDEYTNW